MQARCAGKLSVLVAGEAEGDGAPEEAGAHLHGQVTIVVRIPNPDVAPIFHDTGISSRLHAEGLEGSQRGLDLFAAFYLHGYWDSALSVYHRDDKSLPQRHGLRRGIKDAGKKVREAAGDGSFNVLGLSGNLVLLVEN